MWTGAFPRSMSRSVSSISRSVASDSPRDDPAPASASSLQRSVAPSSATWIASLPRESSCRSCSLACHGREASHACATAHGAARYPAGSVPRRKSGEPGCVRGCVRSFVCSAVYSGSSVIPSYVFVSRRFSNGAPLSAAYASRRLSSYDVGANSANETAPYSRTGVSLSDSMRQDPLPFRIPPAPSPREATKKAAAIARRPEIQNPRKEAILSHHPGTASARADLTRKTSEDRSPDFRSPYSRVFPKSPSVTLRFRPGYSGGAAPDSHRIPKHPRTLFAFGCILPFPF